MRQGINRKSAVLPLSAISTIPRVRTYHTKEPSRFVHALSARPLKVRELTDSRSERGRRRRDRVSGREFSLCADGIKSIFFLLSVGYTRALSRRGRRCPVSATPTAFASHCLIPSTTRKNHKETFLLSYFCMTKRRVQRWLRHPEPSSWSFKSARKRKVTLCFSRANDVRPYKIKSEHNQQTKQKICFLSRQLRYQTHARPSFSSGRADNACTNLLGSFV